MFIKYIKIGSHLFCHYKKLLLQFNVWIRHKLILRFLRVDTIYMKIVSNIIVINYILNAIGIEMALDT